MNALKLVALALAVACGASTALTTTTGSLSNVSLLELVNEAKAAAATNPDLAALFQGLGDVSKLSEAELTKLVKDMLAVTAGSSSSSGSIDIDASSSMTDKSATTAPVVAPTKSTASSVALAPAAVTALLASIVYTLV